MPLAHRNEVRNIAILAHADHGKTTLVDAMVFQAELLREADAPGDLLARILDAEHEKSIARLGRATTVSYREARIHVLDIPAQADFGGRVERTLRLAEGLLLLVDACEGPLPQTRFVLRKALEQRLVPIVVINKMDRPDSRAPEVLQEVRELFADLDASEEQLRFPVLYTDARRGLCRRDPGGLDESLVPLFEEILRTVPPPRFEPRRPLQMLVADLEYDDVLGRIAFGRVFHGTLRRGQPVAHCRHDGQVAECRVAGLFGRDGFRRVEMDEAGPGDMVSVAGLEAVSIGDTLADPSRPAPLPRVGLDEPTLAVVVSANDSPLAGLDGPYVTGRHLRERLFREILTNASVRVEETDSPDAFRVSGRGELHLVILLEVLRREGYEMSVSKPEVLAREPGGLRQEPVELLVVDCPQEFSTVVVQKVGARGGRIARMVDHGRGRVRMEFRIPTRGLLGFRAEFLADTRGTGILHHALDGWAASEGPMPQRATGALVADRPGRATAYAIEQLQPRGTMFVAPGDQVYEGMIVGENSRSADLDVNITKEKRLSEADFAAAASAARLMPPRLLSLEQALEFVRDDELVELTPRAMRLRKRVLPAALRARKFP